jgi:hypothetical protein
MSYKVKTELVWKGEKIGREFGDARTESLEDIGDVAVTQMRQNIRPHRLSGETEGSIMWAMNHKDSGIRPPATEKINRPRSKRMLWVGASARIGGEGRGRFSVTTAIEYGHRTGTVDVKPLPFIRPVLRQINREAIGIYSQKMTSVLARV